jgi:hypothetical protein
MTHMFGESGFAAPRLPNASVGPGEQKVVCDTLSRQQSQISAGPCHHQGGRDASSSILTAPCT